jgi:pimeloyl-ACP methyl ester carboxylesterase
LAGGPQSHLVYTRLATIFQALAYPQFDVVLYDYFGFNCSTALQDVALLGKHAGALTMSAMAADFIHLKRSLIGKSKAYIMGGSHGAMLGAEIVADFPDEIAKAILFSGDTQSGWFAEGWFRFDALLAELAAQDEPFRASLQTLLERADRGEISVDAGGKHQVVDRSALEVALWLMGGLSSAGQAALPKIINATLSGQHAALERIYRGELELLAPIQATTTPTEASVVTNFHRCNVWFPKSSRESAELTTRKTTYLSYRSFDTYWSTLCRDYDRFGEHPFRAAAKGPNSVPILAWVGDRDTFDPEATRARFMRLSSRVEFEVMKGWSHDFGPNADSGLRTVANKIERFVATE